MLNEYFCEYSPNSDCTKVVPRWYIDGEENEPKCSINSVSPAFIDGYL